MHHLVCCEDAEKEELERLRDWARLREEEDEKAKKEQAARLEKIDKEQRIEALKKAP